MVAGPGCELRSMAIRGRGAAGFTAHHRCADFGFSVKQQGPGARVCVRRPCARLLCAGIWIAQQPPRAGARVSKAARVVTQVSIQASARGGARGIAITHQFGDTTMVHMSGSFGLFMDFQKYNGPRADQKGQA